MSFFTMTGTVVKSLFAKPATRNYPFVKRVPFTRTRGSIRNDIEKCIFCGLCVRKCPTYALEVSKPERTWTIDRLACCQCTYCVEVCPVKCLSNLNEYSPAVTGKSTETFTGPAPAPKAAPKPETDKPQEPGGNA